jgi:hypothetical protein
MLPNRPFDRASELHQQTGRTGAAFENILSRRAEVAATGEGDIAAHGRPATCAAA